MQKRIWKQASLYIGVPLGNMLEGSSTGDFEKRMKGALRMERLILKRLRQRATRGASCTGDPGRLLKKASGTGISIGAPLQLRTCNLEGGSYTGDFERCMKEGSSNRASLSVGLHEGDLEGGSFTGDPERHV
jgi:hypothetical protein